MQDGYNIARIILREDCGDLIKISEIIYWVGQIGRARTWIALGYRATRCSLNRIRKCCECHELPWITKIFLKGKDPLEKNGTKMLHGVKILRVAAMSASGNERKRCQSFIRDHRNWISELRLLWWLVDPLDSYIISLANFTLPLLYIQPLVL